jgi:predicted phage-related endonuclease
MVGLSINLSRYPQVIDELVRQLGDRIDSFVAKEADPPLDLGEAAERCAAKRATKHPRAQR